MRPTITALRLQSALASYAVLVVALVVGVGSFLWTNWYFSPERRLERLTELMSRGASELAREADREIWMTSLKPQSAAEKWSRSSCSGSTCEVAIVKLYTVRSPELRYFTIEVSVRLTPELSDLESSTLVAPEIQWVEGQWRWSITFKPTQENARSTIVSGTWNELGKVPRPEGSPALAKYIQATRDQMAIPLQRHHKP